MLRKILGSSFLANTCIFLLSINLIATKVIQENIATRHYSAVISALQVNSRFLSLLCIIAIFLSLIAKQYRGKKVLTRYTFAAMFFICGYLLKPLLLKNEHLNPAFIQQEFAILLCFFIFTSTWLPFIHASLRSFWKFNNVLFIKTIKTLVFSGIFFICFSAVGISLDISTSISVPLLYYHSMAIICFIGFAGHYFITQIPKDLQALNKESPYPKFYQVFANYYLSPLTVIALVLHGAYIVYCLMSDTWPVYQTAVAVALSSIILFLLICQVEGFKSEGKRFMKHFSRLLYIATALLCLFYLVLLNRALKELPLTEFWLFIALLLSWSVCCCLYFIFSKQKDIRFFPISISLILFVLLMPALSPFYLATKSHAKYFETQLSQLGLLSNTGSILFSDHSKLSAEDNKRLLNSIYFLERKQSLHLLAPLYPYPISKDSLTLKRLLLDLNLNSF